MTNRTVTIDGNEAAAYVAYKTNEVIAMMDFALISQTATLEARVPFLHIFDGFRTSHEVMKIAGLSDEEIRAMIDEELVRAHRQRALTPDRPVMRGTAQNPDVFFQSRERANSLYTETPAIVARAMNKLAGITGRQYRLFDYVGASDADRVMVMMGSGCETAEETVTALCARGEKVGLLKVRLYRPFSVDSFISALPSSVRTIAVSDDLTFYQFFFRFRFHYRVRRTSSRAVLGPGCRRYRRFYFDSWSRRGERRAKQTPGENNLGGHIVGIETADKMTDPQIVARVRGHFFNPRAATESR